MRLFSILFSFLFSGKPQSVENINLRSIKKGVKRWFEVKRTKNRNEMLSFIDQVNWFTIDRKIFSFWSEKSKHTPIRFIHAYLLVLRNGRLAYALIDSDADSTADFSRSDIHVVLANKDLSLDKIKFNDNEGEVHPKEAIVRMIRWTLSRRSSFDQMIKNDEVFQLFRIPYGDLVSVFNTTNDVNCLLVYGLNHVHKNGIDHPLKPELLLWRYHINSSSEIGDKINPILEPALVEDLTNPVPPFGGIQIEPDDNKDNYQLLIASGAIVQ